MLQVFVNCFSAASRIGKLFGQLFGLAGRLLVTLIHVRDHPRNLIGNVVPPLDDGDDLSRKYHLNRAEHHCYGAIAKRNGEGLIAQRPQILHRVVRLETPDLVRFCETLIIFAVVSSGS